MNLFKNRENHSYDSCLDVEGQIYSTDFYNVWFQEISIPPPPLKELEIPEGWGAHMPRKLQRERGGGGGGEEG